MPASNHNRQPLTPLAIKHDRPAEDHAPVTIDASTDAPSTPSAADRRDEAISEFGLMKRASTLDYNRRTDIVRLLLNLTRLSRALPPNDPIASYIVDARTKLTQVNSLLFEAYNDLTLAGVIVDGDVNDAI